MATYYVWSGAAGSANGSSWANAFTTLGGATANRNPGDVFYVAHDHSESTAGSITIGSAFALTATNPIKVICVDRAGSVPPVSADLRTTAQVATTGGNNINMYTLYYHGIIFKASGNLNTVGPANNYCLGRFDNCSLQLTASSGSNYIALGNRDGGQYPSKCELNNTTVSFAAVTQFIALAGEVNWRNTPSAILGTVPTSLFLDPFITSGNIFLAGVDLSAESGTIVNTSSNSQRGFIRFLDCKLHASATKCTTPNRPGGVEVDFIRNGATGINYAVARYRYEGTLIQETTIVRSGGASDGTTPISWKVTTTADCQWINPFECPPIAIWNDTIGSAVTATVECIGAAVATDKEVWLELQYLSSGSSPQAAFVNDSSDIIATGVNQTSSSETWGGSTAAFKLAVTFTAQQKGWVYARVKCAKASSTFYVDPLVTLS